MAPSPSGTVTFLFTDVEGSTRMWEQYEAEMAVALELHDEIVRASIDEHDGFVFSTAGDAFAAAFARADDAVDAARRAQEALGSASWPADSVIRVRMGIHTGEAQERDGDYFGPVLNRAARIMSAGHGGQVLVSASTAAMVGHDGLIELGEHRLKDLGAGERIFQVGDGVFPALRSLEAARHNLPIERTPLIGRSDEIGQVCGLVAEHRLVTLLGIGGTGKTRLATAVAAELADGYRDGVWYIDLVPITGSDRVAEAIATAVGLSVAGSDLVQGLAERIAHRETLIVLDNCEHITDDIAELVDVLLEATTGPRFLVTSREPLQLLDERHVHVPPLSSDDATAPAVQLFAATAERVGVSIGAEDVEMVSRVCAGLDGLPLAIELAAGQLRQYTVTELADRLDRRFEILSEGRRGRRRRQASLHLVLEDSWNMLDDVEQELLMSLAAFPSSFAAADVEQAVLVVGPDAAPSGRVLAGLVDRSLVARDGGGRHRLLETVKLFAQGRWPADDTSRYADRHTQWVFDRLGSYTPEEWCTSPALAGWTMAHYEDVRAVEDRLAASQATEELGRLFARLPYTFEGTDSAQSTAVIERINRYLATMPFAAREIGVLNLVAAIAGKNARQPQTIITCARRALDIFRAQGSAEELSYALIYSAIMTGLRDTEAALALLDEAVNAATAGDTPAMADLACAFRAGILALGGRIEESVKTLDDLRPRLEQRSAFDYSRNCYDVVELATLITLDPERSRAAATGVAAYMDYMSDSASWPFLAIIGAATAATGDVAATRAVVQRAESNAVTCGDDPLPDLLLPAAALAWALDNRDAARRWLTAVRSSPTPTHGFYATIIFRQLRDQVGLLEPNPLDHASIESIYEEATDWLANL
jgi:predicted ATPase/class 3 adenylate cyclase